MASNLEQTLIICYKPEMVAYLDAHPGDFQQAIDLALSDHQPYAWRAAWMLFSCMEKNDARLKVHLDDIIRIIPHRKDGHQRELLKILMQMDIGEEQEGRLFDLCMSIWEQAGKAPGVRYIAFRIILQLASKYPELKTEIGFLTQEHYLQTLSPGVKNAVIRLLADAT